MNKIFCIGFNKTGTQSLYQLFILWGLNPYHGIDWRSDGNIAILNQFNCFLDGEPDLKNYDFEKLDQLFPQSKFILQIRNLDDWIASRLAHIVKDKMKNIHIDIGTWNDTDDNILKWVEKRNNYHRAVLDYFNVRSDDLLIINYPKDELAATKIANFLRYDGDVQKLHINKGFDNSKYKERIQQVLGDIDLKNDIFNK